MNSEYLVFGFIKQIINILKFEELIPIEIYNLCYLFYGKPCDYLFLLSGSYFGTRDVQIHNGYILNLSSMHKYSMQIYDLQSYEKTKSKVFHNDTLYESSSCIIPNTSIPEWLCDAFKCSVDKIPTTSSNNIYNMIILSGGYDYIRPKCKWCHTLSIAKLYIFNSNHLKGNKNKITVYCHSLPVLPESMSRHYTIYNKQNNNIYIVGGSHVFPDTYYETGYTLNSIYRMNFNVKYESELKWKRCKTNLNIARQNVGCCFIDNDKMAIVGGLNGGYKPLSSVEIYDITKKMDKTKLMREEMNYKRGNPGSIYSKINNWLIVAGGSGTGNDGIIGKSIEYFDLNKSKKWKLLNGYTKYLHCTNPSVWFDSYNQNILYIAGNLGCYGSYNKLGKIEYSDIREYKPKWKTFSTKSLAKLFKISNKTYTDQQLTNWGSRSLLHFV